MTFAQVLKQFPELTTDRLVLRQIRDEDAEAYYRELSALPHTSAWLDSVGAQSVDKALHAIRSDNNNFARAKTVISWALSDADGKFLGVVRLFDIQLRSKAEIGYWLARDAWGKGLMTEATQAVVAFAFDQLGLHRLYATTHIDNRASQRVLEAVGFLKEGVLRKHERVQGDWSDSVIYGLLSTDR